MIPHLRHFNRRTVARMFLGLGIALSTVAPALAITPTELKAKGEMIVGVQADQYPWGFIDANGQNAGHDIDIVNLMAKELGIKVKFTRVIASNRIPLLTSSQVDFLVAAITMLPDRSKVIQFSKPYASNDITVWARKDADIKSNADLAKYTIGVNRGSAFDTLLQKIAPDAKNIRRFDEDSATVQALLSGQVDAILGSITYGIVIDQAGAMSRFERKYKAADNYLGMSVRLGDKEMNEWLNDFIDRHTADGFLQDNYKKWMRVERPAMPAVIEGVPYSVQ